MRSRLYHLSFELSNYNIQDYSSKILIGMGELQSNGLYFYREVARANKVQGRQSRELWPQRLGHA